MSINETYDRAAMSFSRQEIVQLRDALVHALVHTSVEQRRQQYAALDRALARALAQFE